ncbi:hypothetical protein [Rhizobium mayense]|uniref:hypothetical protein n=1 Tax=Rhizobium mayense TaxID=1312184 RepID=UPI00398C7425
MTRVVLGLDTITITTKASIVFDDAGQPRVPSAKPTPVYRVTVINDAGKTFVSRMFWDEANAERAKARLKEEWEQNGSVPYIDPRRRWV